MARLLGMSQVRTLFNIGKKFVDILDDIWSTLRSILPAETIRVVSPFILGSVGFITHLGEGIQGAREAYRAYKDEKIGQRKTRILSSVLIFMLSGAGLGLATALMVSALGATVSGATLVLAPVLIPGFLTAIYSLALWRKAYVFSRAKEEEAKAKREYQSCFSEVLSDSPEVKAERDGKKKKYEAQREERLQAERDLAFNVVEVVASAMVVTATILGTAALVGASVSSLGALPLALLIMGVVGGVACKLFEYHDEKNNFDFTRRLRTGFIEAWRKLTAKTNSSAPTNTLTAKTSAAEFEAQNGKTKRGSFIHRKLTEEGLIELRPFKKSENSRLSTLAAASFQQPVFLQGRKRSASEDEPERTDSLVKRRKF